MWVDEARALEKTRPPRARAPFDREMIEEIEGSGKAPLALAGRFRDGREAAHVGREEMDDGIGFAELDGAEQHGVTCEQAHPTPSELRVEVDVGRIVLFSLERRRRGLDPTGLLERQTVDRVVPDHDFPATRGRRPRPGDSTPPAGSRARAVRDDERRQGEGLLPQSGAVPVPLARGGLVEHAGDGAVGIEPEGEATVRTKPRTKPSKPPSK